MLLKNVKKYYLNHALLTSVYNFRCVLIKIGVKMYSWNMKEYLNFFFFFSKKKRFLLNSMLIFLNKKKTLRFFRISTGIIARKSHFHVQANYTAGRIPNILTLIVYTSTLIRKR